MVDFKLSKFVNKLDLNVNFRFVFSPVSEATRNVVVSAQSRVLSCGRSVVSSNEEAAACLVHPPICSDSSRRQYS